MKLAFLVSILVLTGGASALLPSDVLIWGDLTEGSGVTVADSSGYGHDGVLTSTAVWDGADKPANLAHSIVFTASQSELLTFPGNAITNVGDVGQDYSVSVWFKSTYTGEASQGMFGQYDYASHPGANNPAGRYPYSANLQQGGRVQLAIYDGATSPFLLTVPVADGEWHHLVFVRDSVMQEIIGYVDGDEAFRFADTSLVSMQQPSDITFGFNPAAQTYFDGKLAQPILFGKALSAHDVRTVYNYGGGHTYNQLFDVQEIPEFSVAGIVAVLGLGVALVAFKRQ